ncbi:MAG: ubiquinol-cytochrome c reductase iron-sulfur subunit [Steroidobacteraceae bacterium]
MKNETRQAEQVVVMDSIRPEQQTDKGRRNFLITAAGVLGAGAVGLFADTLIENMNPGKAVEALGAPIEVDVSRMEPGQLILAEWKKKPIWILKREPWMLQTLSEPSLLRRLKDPHSEQNQQPAAQFINGNYRALRPEIFIAVALCTHMQCIPAYRPAPHTVTPWWPGGFHCPCHGSMYDFSARVVEGSPAPLNIPIPPYYWKTNTVARIGEINAAGLDKDWSPDIW